MDMTKVMSFSESLIMVSISPQISVGCTIPDSKMFGAKVITSFPDPVDGSGKYVFGQVWLG